jgi:hypothetical protein
MKSCRVERRWLRRRLATNSSKASFNTGFVTTLVIGTTVKSGTNILHRAPNVGWNCYRSRCTAMLAGLRTLIQRRHGPDR